MKFSEKYPHIAWWINNHGWVELGTDEESDSLVRLLDEGGTWWEDNDADSIDKALKNAENFLTEDLPDRFGDSFEL